MGNFVLKNVALPMCVDGKQTEHETKEKLTPYVHGHELGEAPKFRAREPQAHVTGTGRVSARSIETVIMHLYEPHHNSPA
jgi:hypothetical protein